MQIYDPRKREDFVLTNIDNRGKSFSSLRNNLFVIDSQRELVEGQLQLLKECIPRVSTHGFFTILPWSPGIKSLKKRIFNEFDSVSEHENTLGGSFKVNSRGSIHTILKIRDELGGERTGEWGIGGCLHPLSVPKRISLTRGQQWDFWHILVEAEKLSCVLYLGDNITTFMTKLFDDFDIYFRKFIGRNK